MECCSASAFAVATLEEGITLRRAFEEKFPEMGAGRVRILVLGSPVGYPNCFDSYLHHNIELMVLGPEVAASLAQWMRNHEGRRMAQVNQTAERTKEELMNDATLGLQGHRVVRQFSTGRDKVNESFLKGNEESQDNTNCENDTISISTPLTQSEDITTDKQNDSNASSEKDEDTTNPSQSVCTLRLQTKHNAATLSNVSGDDLAREVRQILVGQCHATSKTNATMGTIIEPPLEEPSDEGDSEHHTSTSTSRNTSRATSPSCS